MTILTLWRFELKSRARTPRWIDCEELAYQSKIIVHNAICLDSRPYLRVLLSGNEVLRRGDI